MNTIAFASTFYFFANAQMQTQKKIKKELASKRTGTPLT